MSDIVSLTTQLCKIERWQLALDGRPQAIHPKAGRMLRRELYNLVWSQSMHTLAPRFGISDVALKKHCKRHNVPTPPRGYWAKVAAGERPPRTALPPLKGETDDVPVYLLPQPAIKSLATKLEPVPVDWSDDLRGCHRVVKEARKALQSAKPCADELLRPSSSIGLDVHVSRAQVRRTLLILNVLGKTLREYGGKQERATSIVFPTMSISFSLNELLTTSRDQPDEFDLSGTYEFCHSRFVINQVPNGRLRLAISDRERYLNHPGAWEWRDCDSYRIEDKLGTFVARVLAIAKTCDH